MNNIAATNCWPVLNALRKPDSRLIYDGDRRNDGFGYRAMPDRLRVTAAEVTGLLGRDYIRAAPDAPAGVYVLTAAGLAVWARTPEIVTGACDGCGATRNLRAVPVGDHGVLLCDVCAGAAADAATRSPWTCDACRRVVDSLTVWDGGTLLCRDCSGRRIMQPRPAVPVRERE